MPGSTERPGRPPWRVVLADDSPEFLASMLGFVSAFPQLQVVSTAATGEQAVALAELHSPDLVLLDLNMPGIGGLEATRILKSLRAAPKVAVVTLHDEPRFRAAALEAGADCFIAKDRLFDDFPAALARLGLA